MTGLVEKYVEPSTGNIAMLQALVLVVEARPGRAWAILLR
jgi:hypothetical protein